MCDQKLVQTVYNMEIGYEIYQFENKTDEKIYHEENEIPKNTGITLCQPSKPYSYQLELRPKETKQVIYRQTYQVFAESKKLGYNSVIGDDELLVQAQQQGSKKKRSDLLNIYSKSFLYEDGLIMIYKNRERKKKTLVEQLESENFDEMIRGKGESKGENKSFHVKVGPGQSMIVRYCLIKGTNEFDFFSSKFYVTAAI